ncbi:S-methyl-5-thioribose kinase [Amphritea sp. HPY]|uniref:S-methyl-5-thioribose kinase n=1 Tax=Amphritea sp. HPY TaxID=3421652 RepID=UPI003D7E2A60
MSFVKFNDDNQIINFVRDHSDLFSCHSELAVEEISDGNLNYVYRVSDASGNSLIVKQAPPYIRIIGDDWPLTQDRIRIEQQSLQLTAQHCPQVVPEVYHYDSEHCVILMQDIGDHDNLRQLLIDRTELPLLAQQLGNYLAQMMFRSSSMAMESTAHKALVKTSQNPELCKISEEVYFWDPFCDHERNDVNPLLKDEAQSVWNNSELKCEVAKLKRRFMSDTEAMIHGDLHSGSVFATTDSCKIIDPEFSFCGPIGFDIGVLFANFLLNYAGQQNLPGDRCERMTYQGWLLQTLSDIWQQFSTHFASLMQTETLDPSLSEPGYQQWYLQQIWQDSLGYAGVEMTRRTIGIAHVADIMNIEDPELRADSERLSLQIANMLILQRNTLSTPKQLDDAINQLRT